MPLQRPLPAPSTHQSSGQLHIDGKGGKQHHIFDDHHGRHQGAVGALALQLLQHRDLQATYSSHTRLHQAWAWEVPADKASRGRHGRRNCKPSSPRHTNCRGCPAQQLPLTKEAGERATASVLASVHTAVTCGAASGCTNGRLPDSSRMLRGGGGGARGQWMQQSVCGRAMGAAEGVHAVDSCEPA